MFICILIAGIIAILNIFSLFEKAIVDEGIDPSMFDVMFGLKSSIAGHEFEWKQYGLLTFLFVLQVIIMIVALISFFVLYKVKYEYESETWCVFVSVLMAILSLAAAIISFNTGNIMDVPPGYLGFGSVSYAIMNCIICILSGSAIGIYRKQSEMKVYPPKHFVSHNEPTKSTISLQRPTSTPSLTEKDKVDLLLQYKKMLDDGVITQADFEKKKTELL